MTLIDAGREPSIDKARLGEWERRWHRLQAIEHKLFANAMNQLARSNGMPADLSRSELRAHVEDVWEQVRHEACGALGTGTMAQRLSYYERNFTGSALEAQTVAYIGPAICNRVKNVLTRSVARTVSYDELPVDLSDRGISVADQALGMVGYREALDFIADELSPAARAVAGARASSVTSRGEQVELTGFTDNQVKEASKELSAARVHILRRLSSIFGPIILAPTALRRWITPERAEAAVAAGSIGLGVKLVPLIGVAVVATMAGAGVSIERAVNRTHAPREAHAHIAARVAPAVAHTASAAARQAVTVKAAAQKSRTSTVSSLRSSARTASHRSSKASSKSSPAKREFAVAPTTKSVVTSPATSQAGAASASPAAKEFDVPTIKRTPASPASEEFR